jgi:hypothetical protein
MGFKFKKVESSNLDEVAYDKKSKALRVKFKNQDLYEFEPISKEVYKELMEAESIGSYFNKNIRGKSDINTYKITYE